MVGYTTHNMQDVIVSPSDAIALFNQTFDYAYPSITVVGELANFRISRNKWLYFDLKDDYATLKFFGTVYALPGPLQDGLKLAVVANPHLHDRYGFSMQVRSITPVGEGAIKKAAELLAQKLAAEGLFDPARKRSLPYPPQKVGLITSQASAAYADFIKILSARFGGIDIRVADVQVQGEPAVGDITRAVAYFNETADMPDVLVIIRGGGSADDLAAFNHEQVVRAVAGSRIPTMVAIGHEVDISLAELAADVRASTPSNAAELLVPDRTEVLKQYQQQSQWLLERLGLQLVNAKHRAQNSSERLIVHVNQLLQRKADQLNRTQKLLQVLSPHAALLRGYAMVRTAGPEQGGSGALVRSSKDVSPGQLLHTTLADGTIVSRVE